MRGIRALFNQPIFNKEIELLLCPLARDAHLLGDLWGCLFLSGPSDSAKYLPAGTGQVERGGKGIPPLQHLAVRMEKCEDGL